MAYLNAVIIGEALVLPLSIALLSQDAVHMFGVQAGPVDCKYIWPVM